MGGYALAYRASWTHPVFRNLLEAAIWQYLCQNAAWEDCKIRFCDRLVHLKRGQIMVSRSYLAKGFEIGEQVVRTLFSNLQAEGMITSQPTSQGTMITICNYDKYQLEPGYANQPTNQTLTSQLTSGQPAGNQNKNEYNKINNIYTPPLSPPTGEEGSNGHQPGQNGHQLETGHCGQAILVNGQAEAETVKNGSQGSESLFDHLTPQTVQPEPPTGRPKRPVGPSKVKPHPLPLEWEPDEKLWAWARSYYPGAISAPAELDRFKDYFFANGKTYSDWGATFRNWIRKAVDRQAERQGKMPTGDGSTFKTISRFTAGQKLVV